MNPVKMFMTFSIAILSAFPIACSSNSEEDGNGDGDGDGTGGTDGDADGDSDTDADADVCDNVNFQITGRTVNMLIVLDRSESMSQSELWLPMGQALTQVTAQTESNVNFGLLTFPFTDDDCSAGDILIDVAPSTAAAIAEVVGGGQNDVGTSLGTPTAESLLTARAYLDNLNNGLDSFVLLANDGAPNCNDSLDAATCRCSVTNGGGGCQQDWWCLDDAATTQAAAELNAAGYPVYVLGIGDSMQWADVMNAIAQAGGTGSYIPADSADFVEVLMEIVGGIMSCDFDVDWDSLSDNTARDPDKVNLYCKQDQSEANNNDLTSGNVIPKNDGCASGTNGWTWADGTDTTIHMCADMCETIKSGGCPVISASFGCASVDVIPIK